MALNVSRRKYGALTKYLNTTMTDPKSSIRVRYNSAMKLADVLLAADERADKQERRRNILADREYRAMLRNQGIVIAEPETPEPEESASEAASRFLESVRGVTTHE